MNLTMAALAVLAATPLARAVWALGDDPPVTARRAQLAAVGTLVALTIVVGPALATAADVSAPTARIAAGLVIAVTSLPDLWRRVVVGTPTTPTWWVGLVPGAVPETFAPPLAAAVTVTTIDLGVAAAAGLGAAVLGVLALLGLAPAVPAVAPTGPAGRALSTARAAAAVAVGLALVMNGVYDI